MKKIELLSSGKAKSLYTTEKSDQLIMEYRDDTSDFDGKLIEKPALREMYRIVAIADSMGL